MREPLRPASGWFGLGLQALMLVTVAWAIQAAQWTDGLDVLTPAVFAAMVLGAVLGRAYWMPGSLAHGWSIVLGIVGATYLGTRALPHFGDSARLVDLSTVERMSLVRDRFFEWAAIVLDVGTAPDPFVFVLQLTFLLWLVSYLSTWFLVRHLSLWGAVLPSGFALLVNLYYYYGPRDLAAYLVFYVLCALLLAARTHLALQEERWRAARIGFSPDLVLGFLRDGLIVAVVVIGFAWLVPLHLGSLEMRAQLARLMQPTTGFQDQFNRLFPGLEFTAPAGGVGEFGSRQELTGSISLGGDVVFDARVEGTVHPRYWRMMVYDLYDGSSWQRQGRGVERETFIDTPLSSGHALTVPVTQTIRTFVAGARQLVAAPQPQFVSLPVEVEFTETSGMRDPLVVRSAVPLEPGSEFDVVSRHPNADIASLRAAGTSDPPEITERYTRLPGLPERVTFLASEITSGATNRFDAANAIEDYLRASFPYSEQINQPPRSGDRVDWFLFEEQRGYCDYFSSSFVVLARSAGIPTRYAAGYSRGEWDASIGGSGGYRQRAWDGHSWPEVFFPEYGWIQFEPTPDDPEIARAETSESVADAGSELTAPDRDELLPDDDMLGERGPMDRGAAPGGSAGGGIAWWPILAGLLTLAGAGILASWTWRRPLRGLSAAESAFARLVRVAGWLGLRPATTETPHEYGRRVSGSVPEAAGEISTITDAFVRERFGRGGSDAIAGALAEAWHRVRALAPRAAPRIGLERLRRR